MRELQNFLAVCPGGHGGIEKHCFFTQAIEMMLHPGGLAGATQAAHHVQLAARPGGAQRLLQFGIRLRPGAVGFIHGIQVVLHGVQVAVGVDMNRHG